MLQEYFTNLKNNMIVFLDLLTLKALFDLFPELHGWGWITFILIISSFILMAISLIYSLAKAVFCYYGRWSWDFEWDALLMIPVFFIGVIVIVSTIYFECFLFKEYPISAFFFSFFLNIAVLIGYLYYKARKGSHYAQDNNLRLFSAVILILGYILTIIISLLIYIPLYYMAVAGDPKEIFKIIVFIIICVLALITLYHIIRSFLPVPFYSNSVLLKYQDCPQLFQIIYNICKEIRAKPPNNIILEFNNRFYATKAKVITYKYKLKGRTLCLSAPMLKVLTPEELVSILTHEMAHFSGNDVVYIKFFYPIYRGLEHSLRSSYWLSNKFSEVPVLNWLIMVPMLILLGYLNIFEYTEKSISRQREKRADLIAAKITGSKIISSALIKAEAAATQWNEAYQKWKSQALLYYYESLPDSKGGIHSMLPGKQTSMKSHPFDSHPSLEDRLSTLRPLKKCHLYWVREYINHESTFLSMHPEQSAEILFADPAAVVWELCQLEKKYNRK